MKSTTTSMIVLGLGAAVTTVGATIMKKNTKVGAAMTGFGLAHVVLGGLDMLRPSVRNDS